MKLGTVLRIARWEVTKNAGGVDKRTLAVAAVAVLAVAVVAPYAATQGMALDGGIYQVGVDESNPYYDVVDSDPTFTVRDPSAAAFENGDLDLLIRGTTVASADTEKGMAAATELRSTVGEYNDDRMRAEANQSAAFPVTVTLEYVEPEGVQEVIATGAGGDEPATDDRPGSGADDASGADAGSGGDGTGGDSGEGGGDPAAAGGEDDTASSDDGSAAGTDGDSESASGDGTTAVDSDGASGTAGGADVFGGQLTDDGMSGSPSDISPPFPFQSLVLAFLFVVPLNFIIQAYGSTMLKERLERRGELLLVTPVSRFDIIGGKTLPYLTAALAIATLLATGLELLSAGLAFGSIDPLSLVGSVGVSVAAVTPIALLFLSATFVGAMFARSFKELTFVTVTVTVSLTTYAFVPAIFTDVNAIALISPLTLVVRSLQNEAITLGEFAFSTLPSALTAGVLFLLGAGLYREEDMFTQRSIPLKALDMFAARVHGKWSVALVTALLLPFVFVAELLGVAVLFAIPNALSVPAILVVVIVVEEVAKSIHVYAGYRHDRFAAGLVPALVLGAFSGLGFFVAEKLTLLAQLVGLEEIAVGQAAFVTSAGALDIPLHVVVVLLVAPLVLHVVTAAISAAGASRDRRTYLGTLVIAMSIHFCYNYTVVSTSGLV